LPLSDGRWQEGEIIGGLYLADDAETATAEWYRALSELGFRPQDHVPHDQHRWRIDVELADLSSAERLETVGLAMPTRFRQTWSSYQQVGKQVWMKGGRASSLRAPRDPSFSRLASS